MPVKLIAKSCFAILMLAFVPMASAHTPVKSTSLKDGGVYQTVPKQFNLNFAQNVGLASITLENDAEEMVDLNYTRPKSMEQTFTLPMPELDAGVYTLAWRAISKDGHIVKGQITFTVE